MKEVEGEGARQTAEGRADKIFEGTCPKLSTKSKEILARAHGNFEEHNKVLESTIIIINYCIINVSAYYNHIINAEYNYYISYNKGLLKEFDKEQHVEVTTAASTSCLKRRP
jgi:hypothetical protein